MRAARYRGTATPLHLTSNFGVFPLVLVIIFPRKHFFRVWGNPQAEQKKPGIAGQWWHTPLISELGRQKQVDPCKFEATLIYRASSRTARATQRNLVWKTKTKTKQKYPKTTTEKPSQASQANQWASGSVRDPASKVTQRATEEDTRYQPMISVHTCSCVCTHVHTYILTLCKKNFAFLLSNF